MKKLLIIFCLLIFVIGIFCLNKDLFTKKISPAESTQTDLLIQKFESQVSNNPKHLSSYFLLADVYLQKVRETADASYYTKIEKLLATAKKLDSNHPESYAIAAKVDYGRHHFTSGLENARKAHVLSPQKSAYLGLIADAQIELGQYEEAVETIQQMVDMRPDYSSYTRVAYIRELYGDIAGAKEAYLQAISAGSSFPENIAWSYVELGKLTMRDDLNQADTYFHKALRLIKNYSPALEGLGKIAFFQKDLSGAQRCFEQAFSQLSIGQYAIDLGDTYAALGDMAKAKQQYMLAQIAFQTSEKNGVNTDLEKALFLTDHDMDLQEALHKAQAAYKSRPSIYAADVLAWALYKNKRYTDAEKYIQEALRLGEHDSLILFHAGMIAKANNEKGEAKRFLKKALDLHPHFSLQYVRIATDIVKTL